MEKTIELIDTLIKLAGDVTLSEAKTWLQVEENAEALKAEGHESVQ